MTKVVSVGIHIVDILGRHVDSIPAGQNLDLLDEIRITVAGTAAGTSVDMAKLGLSVTAMGAIGNDELGNFLIDVMTKYGINTKYLVRKKGVQTSATMLPIRSNGERPALHVIGANGKFCWEDVDLNVIKNSDYLHMGGTSLLSMFDGKPTIDLLKFAKENGVITTFDLVAIDRPDLMELIKPCLPYIDYFMPGLEEAEMMTGLKNRNDIIRFFLDLGTKCTVFKMGEEGSSIAYYEDSKIVEKIVPVIKSKIIDSTGCGDSYCAGFITGLSKGWDLVKCAELGTACGSLVISGLGSDAGIVDFEKTIEHMNKFDI